MPRDNESAMSHIPRVTNPRVTNPRVTTSRGQILSGGLNRSVVRLISSLKTSMIPTRTTLMRISDWWNIQHRQLGQARLLLDLLLRSLTRASSVPCSFASSCSQASCQVRYKPIHEGLPMTPRLLFTASDFLHAHSSIATPKMWSHAGTSGVFYGGYLVKRCEHRAR